MKLYLEQQENSRIFYMYKALVIFPYSLDKTYASEITVTHNNLFDTLPPASKRKNGSFRLCHFLAVLT
jgi:hypothetical protein